MRDIESDRDVHRRAGRSEQRDRKRQRDVGDLRRGRRSPRAAVSIAGSEASDERVEIATACGAIIAAVNAPGPTAAEDRERIGGELTQNPDAEISTI